MNSLKRLLKCVITLVCILILISGCSRDISTFGKDNNISGRISNSQFKVHYIDVGQGDSILVQDGDKNMLIDTGTNESQNYLISYLKKQNIKEINYMVLTHPHEDHIGGADKVIKNFMVDKIYMNSVSTNTKTFRDLIYAMKEKGLKADEPDSENFKLNKADCNVYGPVNPTEGNLNTYSIVVKVTYGQNKFLFTGDTQSSNEEAMIEKGYDLKCDVLKIAHHGSRTSSTDDFLNYVSPKYAVISCGRDNDYGHPHKSTVEKLKNRNIPLYRTDENGTIICVSDGSTIKFSCSPGDYKMGSRKNRYSK
ncbi:competence protein ComE [Clostridium acetobutylicum]|nr:competence protein ComE [Clostridium acetobutylicum]